MLTCQNLSVRENRNAYLSQKFVASRRSYLHIFGLNKASEESNTSIRFLLL